MARREAGKASSRSAPAREQERRGKIRTAPAPEATLKERVAVLERERDALRAALAREQERARKLEEINATARDRVSWALDALQNILGPKT